MVCDYKTQENGEVTMLGRKPIIAFLGTDGSGKTTVMNAVLPEIEKQLGQRFIVRHLRPGLLPPLGRLRGVKHEKGWVCTDPHGSKPSGFIGSGVRAVYLAIDYILGYWLVVRRVIMANGIAGWIFDRYAYDMLIDPLRFRIKLPQQVLKMLLAVIPKPDLVICLGGDAKAIYKRKPETTLEEVARQLELLKDLQSSDSRIRWIDSTESLEKTTSDVRRVLKEMFK